MELKPEITKSLTLANNNITDQTYKKLVEYSFAELLDSLSPNVTQLYNSKPDVVKELYAAILTAIAELGRCGWSKEEVGQYLSSHCGYSPGRATFFADTYERNRTRLTIKLGNIGTHLPHIVDVEWKIDYIVKTSTIDISEGPIFRVELITEQYDSMVGGKKRDAVRFSCTTEELQDLVYKLRDAARHCHKIAGES